jgi:1-hydroxycarotenoid 3,4-desaturase
VRAHPPSQRSLSAVTWSILGTARGMELDRHNVFFGPDYAEEFDAVFRRGALPRAPTTYICAHDRGAGPAPAGDERLLCLVNAPPTADGAGPGEDEIEACEARTFALLARCGLTIEADPSRRVRTTPAGFEALFPATGGALYGPASHGWMASFRRPGARTRLPGLYMAGGSVHPGAGVPMAATSGQLAALSCLEDIEAALPARSRP